MRLPIVLFAVLVAGCYGRPSAPGPEGQPWANFSSELASAEAIADVQMRDQKLAQLARDAADAEDRHFVDEALKRITDPEIRERGAAYAAEKLAKEENLDEATETAKSPASPSRR